MNQPLQTTQPRSALNTLANRFNVEPPKLLETLKATAFKGATNEEMMALCIVANQYGLNPFTKEIYAFPAKGGGIQPVVSVDGWIRLMNEHPQFDGIEFEEIVDKEGKPISTTASIWRKDRTRPTKVTEWFSENHRNTEPWNTRPRRMLRHKATIQGARTAFGFAGIADEDEAVQVVEVSAQTTPPVPDFTPPTSIEEGATELAPVPRERPARGPRAVRPAPAAELKPQEPAEQPAEAQPALPTAGTEQSNGHAIALLALKGAMDTAEVYEAQIVAFFNEQLRDKSTPEIMEINQIPEGRLVALAKNLNAKNEGVIAKLKGYAPV